ncbi:hypothetical protein HU200_006612 [Digitaria exilis]|uniref:Major facilitator superfamily (MFS) profile domain-containing protein n=1 Tax=Digitaria exilis TaxID=1010633 RepID=A0A835FP46_9POAL|nr:hypothetical protein HU200_006612 [Digitaria exilis]
MAGGASVTPAAGARDYAGGLTFSVMTTCLMAASCGLIWGYDSGSFLSKFFPEVIEGRKNAKVDAYCKYDNQWLTAFTSSLWIAGTLSSLVASRVTRMVGRQAIMLIGGALFLAGSVINAAAVNIAMLIIGRMLLGFGLGFTLQRTMPFVVIGILSATNHQLLHNASPTGDGVVSLGLAAVPGAVIVLGAFFPRHERSDRQGSSRAATHPRSRSDVDAEFKDIIRAVDIARQNDEGAFRRLFSKEYRHYLAIGVAHTVFYEFTGMIVISVFSPVYQNGWI